MASYNLNEMLKNRNNESAGESEVKLDDVARVKVLSPGRQVFKRFIRNRLAVFGSVLLITMFLFAFVGPLVYPYGQKEIFYKYDTQNVNYALAKEITSYTGYDVNADIEVPKSVTTSVNSLAKRMIASGTDDALMGTGSEAFLLERLTDDVFLLQSSEALPVALMGEGNAKIGTYDQIKDEIKFSGKEIEGLKDALTKNFNKTGGEFTFDSVKYTYKKGKAKSYDIYAELDGIQYYEDVDDAGFESAFEKAVKAKAFSFASQGMTYYLYEGDTGYEAYRVHMATPAKVFSRLTFNYFTAGNTVSDDVKAQVFYNIGEKEFEYNGSKYSIEAGDSVTVLKKDGQDLAELTDFSIKRYTGEDSVDYDLKEELTKTIRAMDERGEKSGELTYNLPMQQEDGKYSYDEDGNLQYAETRMLITKRDTGEYLINCDQIIYVIDMFSLSSEKHILGTDGDGFDVLARIMYGGRISLMVGFVVVFLEIILGVIMGGLAGYYGGWVDNLIMRMVDVFYCLPSLPIMIILGAMMDALRMDTYIRLMIMMATLGLLGWAGVARMVRGQILSLREQEFMVAAEATGIRVKDRIFRHLVPNVMPQLIVIATMGMGSVILTESTLSYLGLGVKHPLATWGTIINSVSSSTAMAHYPHIWIPVGLLICLTVIAFNFVGDGLRDAYDPKSKQ